METEYTSDIENATEDALLEDLTDPHRKAHESRTRRSRYRLFWEALLFFSSVCVEIGRRGLRVIEWNVPRYINCVDRSLVALLRLCVRRRQRISVLGVLLMVSLVISVPYTLVTIYRVHERVAATDL